MIRNAALFLIVALCGCAHPRTELSLSHTIDVPKEWRGGSDSPTLLDLAPIHRYARSYDDAWWMAIGEYAKDIHYVRMPIYANSGWPEEAVGAAAGYDDGCERVERLIQSFGETRVSEFLKRFSLSEAVDQPSGGRN